MRNDDTVTVNDRLIELFEKNDFARFKKLAEASGFNLKNAFENDKTPLLIKAAIDNRFDFVRYFYEKGFDVNKIYNSKGKNSVLAATLYGREDSKDMLQFLMDLGAKPDGHGDNWASIVLREVQSKCRLDYIRMFIQNGADYNATFFRFSDGASRQIPMSRMAFEKGASDVDAYLDGSGDLRDDESCLQWQERVLQELTDIINGPLKCATPYLEQYSNWFIQDPSLMEISSAENINGITIAAIGGLFEVYIEHCIKERKCPDIEQLTDRNGYRMGAIDVVDFYGEFKKVFNTDLWRSDYKKFSIFVSKLPMTLQMKYQDDIEGFNAQLLVENTKVHRPPQLKRRAP